MERYASVADRDAIEAEMPWEERDVPATLYGLLAETAARHASRPAVSFQLTAGPRDRAETLDWAAFQGRVTQAANLFRRLGIGEADVVACLMPNANEMAVALLGGATAGIVSPINPLMDAEQIAAILRETGARVLVTLAPFPKSDVAARAAEAAHLAPGVHTLLQVDLARYLGAPRRWAVPFLRPRHKVRHKARVLDFNAAMDAERADRLGFAETAADRVAAYFHTGGTTGRPKVAQHRFSGMIYNGWAGARVLLGHEDTLLCPLPLFHVFAAYPVMMSAVAAGAHLVLPTPAGYRGDGVLDNFWKLVERWKASFVVTVPTAISALMQRRVDADISALKLAFSGSAPLPRELYARFQAATGVTIVEGYGLTEATCLVSGNPPAGEKRIGSVGIAFPHTEVRIFEIDGDSDAARDCATDEVGEICVANPGVVVGATYTEAAKNRDLYAAGRYLRTGDLGKLDADGYLWITGRAKDLIIRGGHNIDPAVIEEALLGHAEVAGAAAIGQPDARAGELPAAYVELVAGATASEADLLAYCKANIPERAAVPKHVEVLPELPKTAVGKIYKPDLRKRAIARVFGQALAEAGQPVQIAEVIDDRSRGLVARLHATGDADAQAVARILGEFAQPWEWAD